MKSKGKRATREMTVDIEAGRRIKKLRGSFTQAEFAEMFGGTQPMVAAFEAGRKLPSSADLWIKFAELAGYPDCYWFYERAGLSQQKSLAAAERMLRDLILELNSPLIQDHIVLIPRVRKTSDKLVPTGTPVPVAAENIQNPLSTYYLVIDENSAGPMVPSGCSIVLDTSAINAPFLEPFWDKRILVDFGPRGHSEFHSNVYGEWCHGLCIGKLLHKFIVSAPSLDESDHTHHVKAVLAPFVISEAGEHRGCKEIIIGRLSAGQVARKPPTDEERATFKAKVHADSRAKMRLYPELKILGIVRDVSFSDDEGHLGI